MGVNDGSRRQAAKSMTHGFVVDPIKLVSTRQQDLQKYVRCIDMLTPEAFLRTSFVTGYGSPLFRESKRNVVVVVLMVVEAVHDIDIHR